MNDEERPRPLRRLALGLYEHIYYSLFKFTQIYCGQLNYNLVRTKKSWFKLIKRLSSDVAPAHFVKCG